jgi:hypothetical protein
MRSPALLLIALFTILPAWPRSAAARESSCAMEFRGCASRLHQATTPADVLECEDGFRACALVCAPVYLSGARPRAHTPVHRLAARFEPRQPICAPARHPRGRR